MRKVIALFTVVVGFFGILGCSPKDAKVTSSYEAQTRVYYIAAEKVMWDFAPSGKAEAPWSKRTKYQKVRYIEYTDDSYSTKKEQPVWLGILGPIIRGVEGDTLKIVFMNKADKPYSMHPHGLLYTKNSEGADHTAHHSEMDMNGEGAKVLPGERYTYTWQVTDKSAPGPDEGGSKVWMYHSHVDSVQDIYDGLVGPIIITSAEHAKVDGTPDDVDKEFVSMFFIFDESKEGMSDEVAEIHKKHAINGTIFDNLKGITMDKGDKVRWHLLGMGNEVDIHSAHWHGEVVSYQHQYTDVIELLPASMKSVDMVAENVGTWMFHCHVADHIKAGMTMEYQILDPASSAKDSMGMESGHADAM